MSKQKDTNIGTLMKKTNQKTFSEEKKIRCEKMESKIFSMKRDTRRSTAQPKANNRIEKIILDAFNDQCAIVADTDDFII